MRRVVSLVSGLTLIAIALVGCVDAARDDRASVAVLFAVLALGIAGITLGAGRGGVTLRRDLASWVDRTSAVTGESPDELTSRAVSRLRASFSATPDDAP